MLTHQQIFDQALNGIRAQGALAQQSVHMGCRYRLEKDGKTLACGVGQLIPDNVYDGAVENASAARLIDLAIRGGLSDNSKVNLLADMLVIAGIDVLNLETARLLSRIQGAHDNSDGILEFEERMQRVAASYDLEYRKPKKVPA
jgi:hypothetical protein